MGGGDFVPGLQVPYLFRADIFVQSKERKRRGLYKRAVHRPQGEQQEPSMEFGSAVDRSKALGDIRGVTYIYAMFYRFGLIDVLDSVREKMRRKEKANPDDS